MSNTTDDDQPAPGERWTDGKYFFEVGGPVPDFSGYVFLDPDPSYPLDQATLPTLMCPAAALAAGRAYTFLPRVAVWRADEPLVIDRRA